MFNLMKTKKPLALSLMAGVAGVMMSGSAAAASYATQGMQPQTEPVATQQYIYSRTTVTETPAYEYGDNDANYEAATTSQLRSTDTMETLNPNGIQYLSGGIGADEQMMLQQAEAQYPVKIVFANSNGAYMSDVDVTVKNTSGETVLGLTTDGPVLLMDLEPGNYTLSADDGVEVKTQKLSVTDSTRTYTMHFKTNEPVGYDRTAG